MVIWPKGVRRFFVWLFCLENLNYHSNSLLLFFFPRYVASLSLYLSELGGQDILILDLTFHKLFSVLFLQPQVQDIGSLTSGTTILFCAYLLFFEMKVQFFVEIPNPITELSSRSLSSAVKVNNFKSPLSFSLPPLQHHHSFILLYFWFQRGKDIKV